MSGRLCTVEGCDRDHMALGLCAAHYRRHRTNSIKAGPIGSGAVALDDDVFMPCPAGPLLDLAAQAAENDARRIYLLLWRAIAHWHLKGHLEETA